jgi:hypothetical protein
MFYRAQNTVYRKTNTSAAGNVNVLMDFEQAKIG